MSYDETVIVVQPGEEPPTENHDEEFYCYVEQIKKKGRRKKTDPTEYLVRFVPWRDINDTELMALCLRGIKPGGDEEMSRWMALSRSVSRTNLVRIITGELDPKDLPVNPVHTEREKLSDLIYQNWRYINTQIKCNTCCWECPDAKVLECVLENHGILRGEEKLR
jgi:hypothetical protein